MQQTNFVLLYLTSDFTTADKNINDNCYKCYTGVCANMKPMKIVSEEFERMKESLLGDGDKIKENLLEAGYKNTGKLSKISPFGWGTEVDVKREYSGGRFQVRMKNGKGRLDYDMFDPDKIIELPWHLLVDSYRLVKSSIGKGRKNYIEFEY